MKRGNKTTALCGLCPTNSPETMQAHLVPCLAAKKGWGILVLMVQKVCVVSQF